ncbi:autotransporter outer membrane beta-barrel domain-containing protein [Mesorhizobium comanense]|uniref:autotransporter outer membrane beta-barrel domain-containing protein n=1 Tax=Mesorhizobium comanense TaxID=2502215 RepID=UPI00148546AE|nr:autotransporter domain-containing protein [Mesorhizobium comanense]
MSHSARRRSLLVGTALAGLALLATPAAAQQWTGATSSDYTVGTNWTGGTAPNSIIAPVIFGSGASTTTVNLDTPYPAGYFQAGSVTFNDPGSAYTVNVSNTAYLNIYGGVINTSGVTQNFTVTGDSSSSAGSFINFRDDDAGSNVVYTINAYGGVAFYSANTASGANAKFVLNGGSIGFSGFGTLSLGSVEGSGALTYSGTGASSGTFEIGALGTSTTLNGQIQEQDGPLSINKVGAGTLTLTGASSYTGGTNLYGGTLSLGNNSALGTGPLNAYNQTTIDIQDGITIDNALNVDIGETIHVGTGTATYSGVITNVSDPAPIFKAGAGTLVLTNHNDIGGAVINGGTIQVTVGDALGSGPITLNGGTLQAGASLSLANVSFLFGPTGGTIDTQGFDVATSASMGDNDTPTGTFTKTGTGTLTVSGFANNNTYSTATDVAQGTLKAGSANIFSKNSAYTVETGATLALNNFSQEIGSLAGAGSVTTGSATLTTGGNDKSTVFSGGLSGSGGLIKTGSGTFELSGDSSTFSGATEVKTGTLLVTGDVGASVVTVDSGAELGGNGTIGGLVANGTVAPGKNAIGTLTVTGNASFAAGSTYAVELASTSTSDLIDASGTATITSGAGLTVTKLDATAYTVGSHYTVLSATGGVTGQFTLDSDPGISNFLSLSLDKDANNVYVDVIKSKSFGSAGQTPNQIATGEGLDSAASSALITAILALPDDAAAQAAFDQLSGEIHASAKGMLLQDSHFLQDAVTARLRAAFGDSGKTASLPVMAYGEDGVQPVAADTDRFAFWTQGFGSWGGTDSDGNAAAFDRNTGGLLAGADGMVGDWRIGMIGGYSRTSFNADDRNSSGDSDNYHLGLYGGTNWGAIAFRTGAAYSWNRISTSRSVAFQGFSDHLSADYDGGTAQAFGELAYKTDAGPFAFEPFANLAYVNLHTDGFTETGGAAALTSGSSSTDATFTTFGVRASTDITIGGVAATARGMFGWRHAYGDVTPLSTFAFAGGDNFTIAGVPIARDAMLVEAGFDVQLARNATLGLSYAGQFGPDAFDNGFKVNLGIKF